MAALTGPGACTYHAPSNAPAQSAGWSPSRLVQPRLAHFPRRPAVLSTFSAFDRRRVVEPLAAQSHGGKAASHSRTVKITRRRGASREPPGSSTSLVAIPRSRHQGQLLSPHDIVHAPAQPAPAAWPWWDSLPSRYKIILGTAVSFVICNLDKVNLSVCIIPMAREYGWSPSVAGLVQSAFFWGYMMCQLPAGYFNSKIGGRRILPAGALLYSAATGIVPWVAATVPGLCISRALVGFGQATAPSAATDMLARVVPSSERARAVTFIFSGFHVGSIAGLLAAPWIIQHWGWQAVFTSFGALGLVWYLWFEQGIMSRIAAEEPDFEARLVADSRTLTPQAEAAGAAPSSSGGAHAVSSSAPPPDVPWRAFLRCPAVRALAYTHFANNWFHYTMLAWLPTYFVDTLSVDLLHASQTALLPPLAGILAGGAAAAIADNLISRGVPLSAVRKGAQGTAFLLPSLLLLAACHPAVGDSPVATVAAITLSLGVSSASLAGLFCTHQDMSPKYAPILLGLTNTTAAIPGVLGVASVGFAFEATQSWELALFLPSAFFMTTAAAVYCLYGRNEAVDFDAADNRPFAWEEKLAAARAAVSRALDLGLPSAEAGPHGPGAEGADKAAPGAVDWEVEGLAGLEDGPLGAVRRWAQGLLGGGKQRRD
ncbi:hypothetical protein HYH03_013570 [Edaphochlamys debaryana]|uniref:Major facilitator superfamily (MFS) profile domain-containing protein n=1 Tax=Edaphochlamys debaryana TaxID=47281 RepID=A0A835XRY7_9CHLO|nr:hypothetical protein HYH03_013570 [Edaphochlamys debaryana]|eukprot:KAG2487853.1 hypothetical protein HYH03_013570 [Edaphochlamys debaryana]